MELRLAHAGARDAVHAPFDVAAMGKAFLEKGFQTEQLATGASNRAAYLARPDLGRTLASESDAHLRAMAADWDQRDLAILVSDGLSATAAETHAIDTVAELVGILAQAEWTLYPIFLVPFARVKLQDVVGSILKSRLSIILLGERPGLSAHDSLGAYLTFGPGADRTDADRNCVSNVRSGGIQPPEAARRLADILFESRRLGFSGSRLIDNGMPTVRGHPIRTSACDAHAANGPSS